MDLGDITMTWCNVMTAQHWHFVPYYMDRHVCRHASAFDSDEQEKNLALFFRSYWKSFFRVCCILVWENENECQQSSHHRHNKEQKNGMPPTQLAMQCNNNIMSVWCKQWYYVKRTEGHLTREEIKRKFILNCLTPSLRDFLVWVACASDVDALKRFSTFWNI